MDCYQVYTDAEKKKIDWLEREFINFTNNYVVHEWEIPALIEGEILKKCGYFLSMPNQLTVASHIHKDKVGQVMNENKIESDDMEFQNYFLTPAACIHIYPMLERLEINNEIITTRARVYRYEDKKYELGKRMWDFEVREFVAVGTPDFVHKFLNDMQSRAMELCQKLGIKSRLNASNDHFYPSKRNEMAQKIQRVNKLKIELQYINNTSELALASFNYHNFHFSKTFKFDKNGTIVTGCVGFGIDRWIKVMKEGGII